MVTTGHNIIKLKYFELKTSLFQQQEPLGLLFKNENTTEDMIEILDHIHKYVPVENIVADKGVVNSFVLSQIFLGGDQLTEERAKNAQNGRADGETKFERLEGIIPKIEDWHTGRIPYQVICFYKFRYLEF